MADEYIRKADAIIQLSHNKHRGDDEWELAVTSDMEIIRTLSPADVVQVVRCRDCREFAKTPHRCELFGNLTGKDDFCSYGERKE